MKDIYETIKDRLSNPFIISFIISWLFWNWQITVGLIWYNAENIQLFGCESYYELININSNWLKSLVLPFLSSVFYTFGFPYLKVWINHFNAVIDRKNENNILKVSQTAKISTVKYIELQKTYYQQLKEVTELIEKESITKLENLELQKESSILNSKIVDQQEEENEWRKLTNPEILEGRWYVRKNIREDPFVEDFYWMIDHGRLRPAHSIMIDETHNIYMYTCDPFEKKATLQIKGVNPINRDEIITFTGLKWSEDMKSLVSSEPDSISMYKEKPQDFKSSQNPLIDPSR